MKSFRKFFKFFIFFFFLFFFFFFSCTAFVGSQYSFSNFQQNEEIFAKFDLPEVIVTGKKVLSNFEPTENEDFDSQYFTDFEE